MAQFITFQVTIIFTVKIVEGKNAIFVMLFFMNCM